VNSGSIVSRIAHLLSAAAGLAACSNDLLGANGIPSRTLSLNVGQTLELTLQTIGERVSPSTTPLKYTATRTPSLKASS